MPRRRISLLALLALLVAAAAPARAEPLDEALWAEILAAHTRASGDTAGTRVDYAALAGSAEWQRLLRNLEQTRPSALGGRAERLAYWINVYNILAIDVVLGGYPLASIRDAGSLFSPVWRKPAGTIEGEPVTLHEVEHEILRPMGEPRIHAAIVCASTSCPSLRREPFTAARIDAQLDDATRGFLADPRKGLALDREAGRVRLSRIFDWFASDFEPGGGVLAFVARHAPPDAGDWIAAHRADAKLAYFDYDWSLNDLAPR